MYTSPSSLVEISLKLTNLCSFNHDILPSLSAFREFSSPVVCCWLWKEPVCWMQTWRRTQLLPMVEMTTTGCHAGSQAPGEVRHRFVDAFLWQLLPGGLQGDMEYGTFSNMAPQTWQSSAFKSGEFEDTRSSQWPGDSSLAGSLAWPFERWETWIVLIETA